MKRSEVISKLAEVYCKDNRAWLGQPRKIDLYVAELMLKTVEQAGMLPPRAEFKADAKYGCMCTMRECCRGCGGYLNEWESEDEK